MNFCGFWKVNAGIPAPCCWWRAIDELIAFLVPLNWIGMLLEILGQPCEQSVHCSLLTESLCYESKYCFLSSLKQATLVLLFHWEKLPFLKSRIKKKGKKAKRQWWHWIYSPLSPVCEVKVSWSCATCRQAFLQYKFIPIFNVNIHSLKCIQGY